MLRAVRAASEPDARLAIFWDNARIHVANVVRDFAAMPEIDILLVRNLSYRPDLNGIERLWAEAKRRYRIQVDRIKAFCLDFDAMGLVQTIMDGISDELVMQKVQQGEASICGARPIEPLAAEIE